MKNHHRLHALLVGLLMIPALASSNGGDLTAYAEMSTHYEAIRRSLLADTTEGVSENARAIQEQTARIRKDFSAAKAGVPEETADQLDSVLEEIESAAAKIVQASDLDSARSGFFSMTRPLAKYRKLSGDEQTVVAYCSMAQKAWIQPEGELGNPYMGQKMPQCGEVVGE